MILCFPFPAKSGVVYIKGTTRVMWKIWWSYVGDYTWSVEKGVYILQIFNEEKIFTVARHGTRTMSLNEKSKEVFVWFWCPILMVTVH